MSSAKMEIQSLFIFALIGAIAMFVITGGAVSMFGQQEPSTGALAAGAVAGGLLGSAASFVTQGGAAFTEISGAVLSAVSGPTTDMKVGLPTF
jgi:hypothetical protein